jgi:hypothetical protein
VHRWLERKARAEYSLKPYETEILFCIDKLTSGELGYCVMSDITMLLVGFPKRNLHTIIKSLLEKDYLYNNGKGQKGKKYFLGLSDKGREIVSSLHISMVERIRFLNDKLKLKSIEVSERNKRVGKKKGFVALVKEQKEEDYLPGEN